MMDTHKVYMIGWKRPITLDCNQDEFIYTLPLHDGVLVTVKCNLKEKKMDVQDLTNKCEIMKGTIIDLDDNGRRWEGDAFNGNPFGYGCYYNANNQIVYSGFTYEGNYVCYGEEYYSDTNTIEYHGTYMNGMRHGYGSLYDMKGKLIYEGIWSFGRNDAFALRIEDKCQNDTMIHNLISELIIGHKCFHDLEELRIVNYYNLKRIKIGDDCFKKVVLFELSECNELEKLEIGANCFDDWSNYSDGSIMNINKSGRLRIHDCSKLSLIDIGDSSFTYYDSFELFGMTSIQ